MCSCLWLITTTRDPTTRCGSGQEQAELRRKWMVGLVLASSAFRKWWNLCRPASSKFKGQKWQETTVCTFSLRRAEQREVSGTLRWKEQDRWAGVMHETERIWWSRHFTTCLWEAAHLLKMANHIHHPHTWHQRQGCGRSRRNSSHLFFHIGIRDERWFAKSRDIRLWWPLARPISEEACWKWTDESLFQITQKKRI